MTDPYTPPQSSLFPEPGAPPEPPVGFLDQLIGVFTEPVSLFQRLRKRPSWVPAFVLGGVLTTAFSIAWSTRVDWEGFLVDASEKAGQVAPPNVSDVAHIAKNVSFITGVLAYPSLVLLTALALWGLATLFREKAEDHIGYPQALSALVVPGLVKVPQAILGLVTVLTRDVGISTPDKLMPTAVGFHLEAGGPKLQALLFNLDPFSIAYGVLALLALRHLLGMKRVGVATLGAVYFLLFVALPILRAK